MPARISMTGSPRDTLLALPDDEAMVLRHHSLDVNDLTAINSGRTPETRLGYALQLCCLRYPGRHLRRGELLPPVMLDHIAEQIGVDAEVIAGFARRTPTRYDQLLAIKARFGFADLTKPMRATLRAWLEAEAIGLTDGCVLLNRFIPPWPAHWRRATSGCPPPTAPLTGNSARTERGRGAGRGYS